jgi:hypothetical protein
MKIIERFIIQSFGALVGLSIIVDILALIKFIKEQ